MSHKVHITAHYDERDHSCFQLEIALNYDGISREDLTEAIRAAVHPERLIATQRDRELGSTEVISLDTRMATARVQSVPVANGSRQVR